MYFYILPVIWKDDLEKEWEWKLECFVRAALNCTKIQCKLDELMLNRAKARRRAGWKPWKSCDEESDIMEEQGSISRKVIYNFWAFGVQLQKDRFGTTGSVPMEDVGAVETRRVLAGRSAPQNIAPSHGAFWRSKMTNCFWDLWGALTYCRGSALWGEPYICSQSPESQCGWTMHHTGILSFLSAGWEILPVGLE